jgi:hypothetical protein
VPKAVGEARRFVGRGLAQHVRGRLRDQLLDLALVEHREARRHVRLERHEMQEALAEGVDGLDLQAARRLDRAREQAAREAQMLRARPLAFKLRELAASARRRA